MINSSSSRRTLLLLGIGGSLTSAASAVVFPDTVADQSGGGTQVVDFTSVEVTNDATNISFKLNLTGDISQANVSDFGNYHIGFNTGPGGTTTPAVLWGQQFGISGGGDPNKAMDFWIGSWVNFGGGSELHGWDGAAWGATIPGTTVTLAQFSTTISIPLTALGLSTGSVVDFDVWSTFGVPGGQSAYDASSNPANAILEPWNGTPYDASTAGAGGTPLISSYTVVAAVGTNASWNVDTDGNWSLGSNWTGGVAPSVAGDTASFAGIITAPRVVTVDALQTVGTIGFNNAVSYTIAGTNAITLDVGTGVAGINVLAGSHTISAPLVLNDDLIINSAGSGVAITGALTATGRAITKIGAGTVQFENVRAAALTVGQGQASIRAKTVANDPTGTSVVGVLAIAAGASLDLANNSMIVDYTGAVGTLVDDVRQHLSSGRLTSSSAVAGQKGLGFGDNSIAFLGKTSFAGQTVDASSLLIKYTWLGDLNLDGQVDITDLGRLATNWQSNGPWTSGDVNYSGFVDITDLGALATNWQAGVGAPLGGDFNAALASVGLGGVSVPEPGSIVLLGLTTLSLKRARRRRA